MGDVVIESGHGSTSLVISGAQRSPIAERQAYFDNTLQSAPPSTDTLTGAIEDTISISVAARELNASVSPAGEASSATSLNQPNGIGNSFLRVYAQARQLLSSDTDTFDVRENYLDHISLSFEALSLSRE